MNLLSRESILKDQLRKAEDERIKAEKALSNYNTFTKKQKLAIELHAMFCTSNHEDACGWHYEENDWSGNSHRRWFESAESIIDIIDKLDDKNK